MKKYPKYFLEKLKSVTAKRPITVIDQILKNGQVTTEELKELGYEHAPRAARDVRELGIPLETFYVEDSNGRRIAAYRFGDHRQMKNTLSKCSGRTMLSKAIKKALIDNYGSQCFIYLQPMESRLLQVDHRIPYEIGGAQDNPKIDCYMLLSPSANRAKSWTCEHCPNWKVKDVDFCMSCFWSHPENYTHVAGQEQRQIIITFTGDEIKDYNQLIEMVGTENAEKAIKEMINQFVK